MKASLIPALALLPLAACAPVPAANVAALMHDQHPYIHYAKADYRLLAPGEGGNCAAWSFTAAVELMKQGAPAEVRSCTLKNGESHAYVVSGQYALDTYHRFPVSEEDIGCAN